MATILKTVERNTAPGLLITCKRGGVVIVLTGCLVSVIIAKGKTITQTGRSATVTDATNGVITYNPLATDFPTKGTYKCDVKIVYSDLSEEVLYDQLKVKARSRIS